MLWMEPCTVACVATLGGLIGGCLMALSQKATNRYNMTMMEEYWNADIRRLESHIAVLEQKLSTNSVNKAVSKDQKHSVNKGYNHKRRFNQGA